MHLDDFQQLPIQKCAHNNYTPAHVKNVYNGTVIILNLANPNYHTQSINHYNNEYGFRVAVQDDFEHKKGRDMLLGCSISYGMELEEYNTASVLNKMNNFGVVGGSVGTCYRVLKNWIDEIEPNNIFFQVPEAARREYLSHDTYLHLTTSSLEYYLNNLEVSPRKQREYFVELYNTETLGEGNPIDILDDDKNNEYKEKHLEGAIQICQDRGVKLHIFDQDDLPNVNEFPKARDNRHPGADWNRKFAQLMKKRL